MGNTVKIGRRDIAELERLAALGNRLGMRARVALALGRGEAPARIVESLNVTFTTIRAVRRRLSLGGIAALKERYAPGGADGDGAPPKGGTSGGGGSGVSPVGRPELMRFRAPVPAALLERAKGESRRGPVPAARIAIETWVRDAAALGLLPPGARLPDHRWLMKRFSAAAGVVRRAVAALSEQGWLRTVPRQGAFLADPLPFSGRYLMLLTSPIERPKAKEGIDDALERAAREQEPRRSVRWTIREALPVNDPDYLPLLADIACQRWAGVFIRAGVRILGSREGRGHYSFLDRVPISGFLHPILRLGSHVRRVHMPDRGDDALDSLLSVVRGAGRRRALVLAVALPGGGTAPAEDDARRRAREVGLEIPSDCFVPCSAHQPWQLEAMCSLALRIAEEERCDSILCFQDNFAEPLDRALVARYGAEKAARRFLVAAWGSFPITQETATPFVWRGNDIAAILDSFVDWCDAIHAGV